MSAGLRIVLIGLLSVFYKVFPDGDTLVIGNSEFYLPYFLDWPTFIYHLSILLIPALVASIAIFILPRDSTSRPLLILLGMMLFINVWFLWHMLDRLREIEGHSTLLTILVAGFVVSGVFLIRKYRKPTEREKRLRLLELLQQIDEEDLPALRAIMGEMKNTSHEMKEYHFTTDWKKLFQQNSEMGRVITDELSQKVKEAKKDQS
ncbi:MAG: hypothetical protein U5L96_08105 [Owenweeksia sp.]|nr:hypothetical protein [Owenweeksia sp.]